MNHCHPFIKGKNINPSKEEGQHKLKKRKKERPFKLNKLSTKIKTEKLAALSSHFCTGWCNCLHGPTLEMTAPKMLGQLGPSCPPVQDAVSHVGTKGHTVAHPLSWSSPSKHADLSSKLLVCLNNQLWDFTPSVTGMNLPCLHCGRAGQSQMFQSLFEGVLSQNPAFA